MVFDAWEMALGVAPPRAFGHDRRDIDVSASNVRPTLPKNRPSVGEKNEVRDRPRRLLEPSGATFVSPEILIGLNGPVSTCSRREERVTA
jgi:hypothetical protein